MAFNKVILMGNLTDNPELRKTASGVSVANFRIAVQRRFKSEGQSEADFFNVVAWNGLAEHIAKFFVKGKAILISGNLQNRQYVDKDGIKRTVTDVVCDEVSFVGNKNDTASDGQMAVQTSSSAPAVQSADTGHFEELSGEDDLPF